MFKWIKDKLEQQRRAAEDARINFLARVDDPVAVDTEWTPLHGGGTNFRTHHLVVSAGVEARFEATMMSRVFHGIFLVAGLGMFAGGGVIGLSGELGGGAMLVFGGALFLLVGGFLLRSVTSPRVFDLQRRVFRTTHEAPPNWPAPTGPSEGACPFDAIHAIQLMPERVRGKNHSYTSWEINLVLRDGKRIGVVDHGDAAGARQDAQRLSELLGVPVWEWPG